MLGGSGDGELEFLGRGGRAGEGTRIPDRVGGEIEEMMREHPGVGRSAVVLRERKAEKQLVGIG